jgi:hypothetical protein
VQRLTDKSSVKQPYVFLSSRLGSRFNLSVILDLCSERTVVRYFMASSGRIKFSTLFPSSVHHPRCPRLPSIYSLAASLPWFYSTMYQLKLTTRNSSIINRVGRANPRLCILRKGHLCQSSCSLRRGQGRH